MKTVILQKEKFYADYFWSQKDGSEVREDIFVKEYLNNYFTLKDLLHIRRLVGREKLLDYAKETGNYKRIEHLLDLLHTLKS